jgi:hypothetical protein
MSIGNPRISCYSSGGERNKHERKEEGRTMKTQIVNMIEGAMKMVKGGLEAYAFCKIIEKVIEPIASANKAAAMAEFRALEVDEAEILGCKVKMRKTAAKYQYSVKVRELEAKLKVMKEDEELTGKATVLTEAAETMVVSVEK